MSSNLTISSDEGAALKKDALLGPEAALALWERFLWAIVQTTELMKTPKSYGLKELWHSQEIHTLAALAQSPGISAAELARKLTISRSAVAQVVKRLEARGVITRHQQADNKKEKIHVLTPKGELLIRAHEDFHGRMETPTIEHLAQQPAGILENLEFFIKLIEDRAALGRTLVKMEKIPKQDKELAGD